MNTGKVVTVPQTEINFNGWTGVGYIIIDPTTGAGAYMISGGLGGAILAFVLIAILAFLALTALGGEFVLIPLIVLYLTPLYGYFIYWLAGEASSADRACVLALIMPVVFFLFEFEEVDPLIDVLLDKYLPTDGIKNIISLLGLGRDLPEIGNKCF